MKKNAALIAVTLCMLSTIARIDIPAPREVQAIQGFIIENFDIAMQILPRISEILNDCKIKPDVTYQSFLVDKSA